MRQIGKLKGSRSAIVKRPKGYYNQWIEIISAVVISLATVVSAWCAYQSARWAGVAKTNYALANAARTESVRMYNRSLQLTSIDVNLFTEFLAAYSNGNDELADFLMTRFRPEMKLATEAWIATQPIINPDAPPTPFDMAEYQSAAQVESDRLLYEADEYLDSASGANERSDEYFLLTVIFASVLFFGGISSKFKSIKIQIGLLVFSYLILLITVIFVMTFPIL
jgi:hypothetical protein